MASKSDIEKNIKELVSYADIRKELIIILTSCNNKKLNYMRELLSILDLAAIVANGDGADSQEAGEKLYFHLS
jgi:hypothetical protein